MATLHFAYKVVQRIEGRLWSANAEELKIRNNLNQPERWPMYRICEYKFHTITNPVDKSRPYIFVTPDEDNAKLAKAFYGGMAECGKDNILILKGVVQNMVIGNQIRFPDGHSFRTPIEFQNAVCDWFLPLSFVKS